MSPRETRAAARRNLSVIWQDIECGPYSADLGLWEELASAARGPLVDLGCGVGRVALHLARAGHEVLGLELDAELAAALNQRAAASDLPAAARVADARDFDLGRRFAAVLAPMQFLQVLGGAEERRACLRCARAHLQPGGRVAAAIVDGMPPELIEEAPPPLPDTLESEGWIHSSLPLDAGLEGDTIIVRRLRQSVSPAGELGEELDEVPLKLLSAETVVAEAASVGLSLLERLEIGPTDDHVGSSVLILAEGH